jgi:hypothetical protein
MLEDDFFVYKAQRAILVGDKTGQKHFLGEAIKVKAEAVDFILLESKWELVTPKKRRRR